VIAVVPIGYADGFSRHFSSNGHMLVRGERAPIVGRICMDLTMLDVGHIPGVAMEDEVVVFGRQNGAFLSVDELAERIRTINYEIVSNLNPRVKRVYLPS
jgi:alanine racemase